MSRGPGKIERRLVELLAHNEHVDAMTLTAYVYQEKPPANPVITKAQYSSVRRVLARLQRRGQVIKFRGFFCDVRYTYANKDNAFALLQSLIKTLGRYPICRHPNLLTFYREEVFVRAVLGKECQNTVQPVTN